MTDEYYCPVCSTFTPEPAEAFAHRSKVNCPRCGIYEVSDSCRAVIGGFSQSHYLLIDNIKKASVGYWLRSRQVDGKIPLLDALTVETLAKAPWFPALIDQRENLLRMLGAHCEGPGHEYELDAELNQYTIGCRDPSNVDALVARLEKEELIEAESGREMGRPNYHSVSLTFDGWLAFEELARGKTSGRTAFMAMPFNKPDLDKHWLPGLRTAVGQTGFTLKRVDDEPKPGLIDIRMQVQIKEARFLIVELTHANNGAYWEAGFAAGLGKPVIYTIRKGEKPHFDVEHWLRIEWDPDKIGTALESIKATIRNALPDAVADVT